MDHREVTGKLLDLVEDALSADKKQQVLAHIEECEECRDIYKQYRSIISLEKEAAVERPYLAEDLSGGIIKLIEQQERSAAPQPAPVKLHWLVGSLMSINVVLLMIFALMVRSSYFPQSPPVLLAGSHGVSGVSQPVSANAPFVNTGYQPLTVNLESPDGLNQLTNKDALVDVKCLYEEGGKKRDAILSQLVRVQSFSFTNEDEGEARKEQRPSVTVTLLIPEKDIRRVELARLLGKLSLSVIVPPERDQAEPRTAAMTIYDPSGRPVTTEASPSTVAVMYEPNPKTGSQTRRVFVDGQWKEGKGIELTAF